MCQSASAVGPRVIVEVLSKELGLSGARCTG